MSQSASQAAAFYRDAARSRTVWTLCDAGGYPAPKNREGVRAQPFWSSRTRVEKIVATVPAYSGFEIVEVGLDTFLDKWLPSLEANGLRVGVNWSGPRATGYDIEPSSIRGARSTLPWIALVRGTFRNTGPVDRPATRMRT